MKISKTSVALAGLSASSVAAQSACSNAISWLGPDLSTICSAISYLPPACWASPSAIISACGGATGGGQFTTITSFVTVSTTEGTCSAPFSSGGAGTTTIPGGSSPSSSSNGGGGSLPPYVYSSPPAYTSTASPGSTVTPLPVTTSSTLTTLPSPTTTAAPTGTSICPASACLASVSAVDACATDCIKSAGSSFGCASLDLDCQCSNYANIQGAAAACVVGACGGGDVASIIAEASAVCQCNSATPGTAC